MAGNEENRPGCNETFLTRAGITGDEEDRLGWLAMRRKDRDCWR